VTTPYPALVEGLRAWAAEQDQHIRAAVELLIEHGVWLHRPEFCKLAVRTAAGRREAWISWSDARASFTEGAFLTASSTEVAILDLAIALGENRYRLSSLGAYHSRMVAAAVCRAVGVPKPA
jgi:hypothetical protein